MKKIFDWELIMWYDTVNKGMRWVSMIRIVSYALVILFCVSVYAVCTMWLLSIFTVVCWQAVMMGIILFLFAPAIVYLGVVCLCVALALIFGILQTIFMGLSTVFIALGNLIVDVTEVVFMVTSTTARTTK
jgi:hypothetical protein